MNPAHYQKVLAPERSGVYLAPDALDELREAAARAGLAWFELDAAAAADKQGFLAACARSFGFPDWFGANWDALADCLRDLTWRRAPGYVVFWHGSAVLANAAPEAFATALEIFRDAASYWKERGGVFLIVLDEEPAGIRVPRLPRT